MKNLGLLLSCATLAALPSSLAAQSAPATEAPAELNLETSQNATINLIRLLVEQGVIPRDAAVDLIRQAEAEARQARAQTAAVTTAAREIRAAAEAELALNDDDIRVTYVPETVRREIAADVRNELAAEARAARASGIAQPGDNLPSWVSRLRPYGDLRVRYSGTTFDTDAAALGSYPDFNAINTGSPFDVAGTVFSPQLNTDQERDFVNLRARLGLEIDLSDGYSLGFRLATGNNASPVSTNQTVGAPGNFQKYSVWLDQAFLRYETSGDGDFAYRASVGRFPNPFFKSEITWDDDIQLDGFAFHGTHQTRDSVKTFLTAGLFPVFNTSLNFPANQPEKFESTDRYLAALQIGADYRISKRTHLKAALAYYYFADVEGKRSTPYVPLTSGDAGDTDGRRPTFAQKGNTYMPLRDILPDPSNNFGTINQWQYFGLASKFAPLVFTAQLDLDHYEPFRISLYTEVVKNFAYNAGSVDTFAVNNRDINGNLAGGDLGWIIGLNIGQAVLQERGDWRAGLNYRYVESDSFVDGFVDSDFGLGGTNLKGFTIGGQYSLSPSVFIGARWLSASEVAGPAFRNDLFQVDINSKF